MPKRHNKVLTAIQRYSRLPPRTGDILAGHPCGTICYASYLARNPRISSAVSQFLENDAVSDNDGIEWGRWVFASMIKDMQIAGCTLSPRARKLVKWWDRSGNPEPWLK
jgi:hypothetical protein